jgi:hypothetical protein
MVGGLGAHHLGNVVGGDGGDAEVTERRTAVSSRLHLVDVSLQGPPIDGGAGLDAELVDLPEALQHRGGRSDDDEGGPDLRPKSGPGYYAAFVRDLDGNRIEAVCQVVVGAARGVVAW